MTKWKKALPGASNMTCYQGEVNTNYARLVEVFGEPHYTESGDGKVTAEWVIEFNGEVATIYDWKTGKTPMNDYSWHIGGHKRWVVAKVAALVA